jgi:toxin ParE1/3/4
MARDLIWSYQALDDIDATADRVGRGSFERSCTVVAGIADMAVSIAARPELGRKAPELDDDGIRECFVHGHRLIYEIFPARIHVLHIARGRRRVDAEGY